MAWSFDNKSPVSLQIATILKLDIVNGKYKAGESFPTVRQLACDASVNPNTMQKALSILENDGLLVTKSTSGRFVTEDISIIEGTLLTMQEEFISKVINEGKLLGLSLEKFIKLITDNMKGDKNL